MYTIFFALLGMLIVIYSFKCGLDWGIFLGTTVAVLSFWVKIYTFELLWPSIYLLLFDGFNKGFLISFTTLIFMLLLFTFIRLQLKEKL